VIFTAIFVHTFWYTVCDASAKLNGLTGTVDLWHIFIVKWRIQHGHSCMDSNLLHLTGMVSWFTFLFQLFAM